MNGGNICVALRKESGIFQGHNTYEKLLEYTKFNI